MPPMIIRKEQLHHDLDQIIAKEPSVIYWCEHKRCIAYLLPCDTAVWKKEISGWRKHFLTGKMEALEGNNKDKEYKGKKYYQIVIQQPEACDLGGNSPLALLGFSEMVSGWVYYFPSKKVRDNLYTYLTKPKSPK